MDIILICDISGYSIIYHDNFLILDIVNAKKLDISTIESYLSDHNYDCVYLNQEFYRTFRKYYPRVKARVIPVFTYQDEISSFFFKLNLGEIKLSQKFDFTFDYKEESCLSVALASLSRLTHRSNWAKYA